MIWNVVESSLLHACQDQALWLYTEAIDNDWRDIEKYGGEQIYADFMGWLK